MRFSINLDHDKFYGFNEHEMDRELKKYREYGVSNFEVFYGLITNVEHVDFKHLFLKKLSENGMTLNFHAPLFPSYTTFESAEDLRNKIDENKKTFKLLRENLMIHGIDYRIGLTYHGSMYKGEESKDEQMKYFVEFATELSEEASKYNFDFLIETLSKEHPIMPRIGDGWDDIEYLCKEIENDNFGITWDMGHTHVNHLELGTDRAPSEEVLKRVKFTNIYDWNMGVHKVNIADSINARSHLPLIHKEFQDEEIKSLRDSGYNGLYGIECRHDKILKQQNMHEKDILESFITLKEILQEK